MSKEHRDLVWQFYHDRTKLPRERERERESFKVDFTRKHLKQLALLHVHKYQKVVHIVDLNIRFPKQSP